MFSEQLFFISFARIWARNMKPEEAVSIDIRWFTFVDDMAKKGSTDSNGSSLADALSCGGNGVQHP